MGITIFKIFIWGGISLDICSEITFYSSACVPFDAFEIKYNIFENILENGAFAPKKQMLHFP